MCQEGSTEVFCRLSIFSCCVSDHTASPLVIPRQMPGTRESISGMEVGGELMELKLLWNPYSDFSFNEGRVLFSFMPEYKHILGVKEPKSV